MSRQFGLDAKPRAVNIRRPNWSDLRYRCFAPFHPLPSARMMMAYDSSQTPPSRLDESTIEAVRTALRHYTEAGAPSDALHEALVGMAAEAREKSMLPEHLLIVLKSLWSALPEVRAMGDMSKQIHLQQRVVTMCIKEYYSS